MKNEKCPVLNFTQQIGGKWKLPIINTIIREVMTDKPVRNVKYLKTFKKEY